MQVNGPVWHKDCGIKEQRKAEKQTRKLKKKQQLRVKLLKFQDRRATHSIRPRPSMALFSFFSSILEQYNNNNNNNNRIKRSNEIFLQSAYCAANCRQHVHSSGLGAIMCRSRAISLRFTTLGETFAYKTAFFFFFFNPTIEVVTFHLRGWCTLGVFLLLTLTRLGHECQDLLSPCNGMHMSTD